MATITDPSHIEIIRADAAALVARANTCLDAAKKIPHSDAETNEQYAVEVCRDALVREYEKLMNLAHEGLMSLPAEWDGD